MKIHAVVARFFAILGALAVMTASAASAKGVTLIQQNDGSVRAYNDVYMRLANQTLWIRSADHKGVLQITNGACSFTENVERCLPYAVTLHQFGKKHQIAITHGTVYLNLASTAQNLPLSSEMLAPRTVLVLLHTEHGTFITVKGTLDEVGK